jgi:hypothetical protein
MIRDGQNPTFSEEKNMRRLALISFVGVFALSAYCVATASAAGYSNATLAGSFACIGSGYVEMKNAWVPSSSIVQSTGDASGAFSGSITTNTAGVVCSGTFKGTLTTNPDGTGSSSGSGTNSPSNPAGCPPPAPFRNVSVITSPNSFYLIGADPGFTGWTLCTRQSN